jgi:hypothetical protein
VIVNMSLATRPAPRPRFPPGRSGPTFQAVNRLFVSIYLEDHLALAVAGARLARRCRAENQGSELGRSLDRIVPELDDDRRILRELVRDLRHRPSFVKQAALSVAELAGRLKPNGRLVGYSDLSRLEELEALVAASRARAGLWALLEATFGAGRPGGLAGHDFGALAARAAAQAESLEHLRVAAGRQALLREERPPPPPRRDEQAPAQP